MAGGRYVYHIIAVVGAVLAACLAPTADARIATVGTPLDICVARVRPGDTLAGMMRATDRFSCTSDQAALGPGDFWALSAPVPSDAPRHLRVRLTSLWQRGLTLHAIYADGKVATIRTTSATLSRHVQLGAIVEFAVPMRRAPVSRLMFRVDGSANARGVVRGLHVADGQASARANTLLAAMYAAFVGMAFALLAYNLSLWAALRHRFQLAYCAMVTALIVYTISSSGALAWLVPDIDNNVRIRVNYVCLGFAASFALLFARAFFEPRIFNRWLSRATAGAIALVGSSGVIFALFSSRYMVAVDHLSSWMFVSGLLVVPPILWRAWRRESHFFWLFSVAWAAPILFASARILAALNVIPASFWLDNSTVLAMAVEALLSNFAIAYRVHLLSRERDEARARETAAWLLADADPLTGLLNRRAFLTRAIGREGRHMLHVVDIDHFKLINETLGHDGGDEVLRLFARTLRASVPAEALVARFGGEEFVIVTTAAAPIDPDRLLARLRTARMPFDLSVTASIGSCTGPIASESDWKQIYRRADRALFDAKAAGRDRARLALPVAA